MAEQSVSELSRPSPGVVLARVVGWSVMAGLALMMVAALAAVCWWIVVTVFVAVLDLL